MTSLLLFAGCIATSFHPVAGHRSDVDDVSVLLTLKTFTVIGSASAAQHNAAVEATDQAHSTLSEDLLELDQLTKIAAEVSDYEGGYAFQNLATGPMMTLLLAISSVLLLACGCACVCGSLRRRAMSQAEEDRRWAGVRANPCYYEVWTKHRPPKLRHRLADLFKLLDEGNHPGFTTEVDVAKAMSHPSVAPELAHMGINQWDGFTVFRLLDKNGDGLVSVHDFTKGLMNLGTGSDHHSHW